ncbi:MAG: alpha/beta fold hydrolase [Pseudoalteromonas sp.]|uniref:alpha/beta fold hydrolase n=1 Tax=unclassified Pseudoalteromonas TaxID=194690 RepID=UPI003F9910F0
MQSFSVQTAGLTLQGLTFGSSNEIVIALHGWLDNCHSFIPLLKDKPLQQKWYCVDFPGHGKSDWRSPDAHYYFIDYVDDIYNLIESLNYKKVHLVGHSMGAMAAGLFASCFPEKVKSVTLIEAGGMVTTPESEVVEQLRKAILNRNKANLKSPRHYTDQQSIVRARALVSDLPIELVELLMKRNSIKTDSGWQISCDPKLKIHSGFRFDEAQCITAIKNLTVPTQVILGQQGYLFVRQNLDRYAIHYKQLKIVEIAGGHHCHMQSPDACLEHIHAFILQNSSS